MTTNTVDIRSGLIHSSLTLARDIKLSHSVFALPFALLGLFMAAWPSPPLSPITGGQLAISILLVIMAMVSARTAAMLANRWLDHDIDARNPRTAGRALPSGKTSPGTVLAGVLISILVFLVSCLLFRVLLDNWWPMIWATRHGMAMLYPAEALTWACHLWLGASGHGPLAAAIAVQ